jgi:hypothetical protein
LEQSLIEMKKDRLYEKRALKKIGEI